MSGTGVMPACQSDSVHSRPVELATGAHPAALAMADQPMEATDGLA